MTVFNLGSINADYFYQLPHLPGPGETIAASDMSLGLGGKGANMSVAIARAGVRASHIGAVGRDGQWAIDRLVGYGVDVQNVAYLDHPTGHAIVARDPQGENQIIIYPGANVQIGQEQITKALAQARPGDSLLLQNETNNQEYCAALGSKKGLFAAYAAAPFSTEAVRAVLPHLGLLFLNEVEADQLAAALKQSPAELAINDVIVTLGARGCRWFDNRTHTTHDFPAIPVTAVDTTGAGDTFTGYVMAGLDQKMPMPAIITLATRAAALMVTRHGTADVIPTLAEANSMP
jgi:ribokinase